VKNLILRPALAITCGISLLYDVTVVAIRKLQRSNPSAVRERRIHARAPLDAVEGLTVLKQISALAEKSGVCMFPVSGTLLGLHRQNRLLEHDYDIDVGVTADDPNLPAMLAAIETMPERHRTIVTRLNKLECSLNPWLGLQPNQPLLYKYLFRQSPGNRRHFVFDVFIHFRANGYVCHGNFRSLWINSEMAFMPRTFGDSKFMVPKDVDTYLTENYGDYVTENRHFESSTDCPNAANIYGFRSAMWLTGRYAYFLATKEPAKRRIIQRRLWDYVRYGLFLRGRPSWRMHQYDTQLDITPRPR
jgi:hypothetical protein